MYSSVVAQVEKARERSARFHRVDLHVHSSDSDDFPRLGSKFGACTALTTDDLHPSPGHFVAAARAAGLRVMAMTDHNKSKVAEDIIRHGGNGLTILPGMEVAVQASIFPDSVIHLLAILPEHYSHADIERIFGAYPMPTYNERTCDFVCTVPVSEFIKNVHAQEGICVASHVNSNKGLRSLFRLNNSSLAKLKARQRAIVDSISAGLPLERVESELKDLEAKAKSTEDSIQDLYLKFIADNRFDAIEVEKPSDRNFYVGSHVDELGIRTIPCLVGSDAHCLGDIGLPGSTSLVKMTKPGLADLKRALLDPGSRIRFGVDGATTPVARVLGIHFEGGFFGGKSIGFSDNLTCLIGGRGSGKSATVEALRHIFGHPLPSVDKQKHSDILARLDHTLSGCEIKVVFADEHGSTHILKRRYGEPRTLCLEVDGTACPAFDVQLTPEFKVKLFGWGEIEQLARSKIEQIALIDGFVSGALEARNVVKDRLRILQANTAKAVSAAKEVAELTPRVAGLSSKESQLAKLDDPAIDSLFEEYDQNQKAQTALAGVTLTLQEIAGGFRQEDGSPRQIDAGLVTALDRASDRLQGYDWFDSFESAFGNASREAQLKYGELLTVLDQLQDSCASKVGNLESDQRRIEIELNRVSEESASADVKSMLSLRKTLTDEIKDLRAIQERITLKEKELADLLADRWNRIVPELLAARREVTRLRRTRLKEVNKQLADLCGSSSIVVSVQHQRYRRDFELALGSDEKDAPDGLLKYVDKHYRRDKYASVFAARHSPHTFVRAILDASDVECKALQVFAREEGGTRRSVIDQEKAAKVKEHLRPFIEGGDYNDPEGLRRLLSLEECDTEDLPQISLDGKLIETLSPGQRCCALIPVILLESTCPLIVDQPEDNLDNKLVFSLVVDIVRSLKEKRQIIMATHNPNIPVSGDAEQIVVFEAPTRERCDSLLQGSIDCDDIIGQVKAIMEGSELAFRIRAQKYGYLIPTS